MQATLNLRDVARLPITLPPKKEREAIEGILSALDDKIELNRQTNETLEAMARALFQSWFVDFDPVRAKMEGRLPAEGDAATARLFPESLEDSSEGTLPRGWHYGSVYELCKVRYGAPYASRLFNTEGRGFPLVRIRDLSTHNPEVFTEELHPAGFTVESGEILVGMDGEFRAQLWLGATAVVNQRVCKFIPNSPW
ncbi:Type I restriction modification DNA specificity domain protein [Nannocystis exedens]|nr:Type I restriction modification DNA specificity domain protein [Nannocystis exedens]